MKKVGPPSGKKKCEGKKGGGPKKGKEEKSPKAREKECGLFWHRRGGKRKG